MWALDLVSPIQGLTRWWNGQYMEGYDALPFPTETHSDAPPLTHLSLFARRSEWRSGVRTVIHELEGNQNWLEIFWPSSPSSGPGLGHGRGRKRKRERSALAEQPATDEVEPSAKKHVKTADGTKRDLASEGKLYRTYKVRMDLTHIQRKRLRYVMAAYRRVYNITVKLLRRRPWIHQWKRVREHIQARRCLWRKKENRWAFSVHIQIANEAIKEAVIAHNTNVGHGKAFSLKFKSVRRTRVLTMNMQKHPGPAMRFQEVEDMTTGNRSTRKRCLVYMPWMHLEDAPPQPQYRAKTRGKLNVPREKMKDCPGNYVTIRDKKWLIEELLRQGSPEFDTKISWERYGTDKFYLCVIVPKDKQISTVDEPLSTKDVIPLTPDLRITATDPGVRVPATFYTYSPSGTCKFGQICHNINAIMERMMFRVDDLVSLQRDNKRIHREMCRYHMPDRKHHKKYRLDQRRIHRAQHRTAQKWRDRRTNAHCHSIRYLLQESDVLLLPVFQTSRMSRRGNRRITNRTVRKMATFGHYQFRMRALMMAEQYPDKKVVTIEERGSSKTDGHCGFVNVNLRSEERWVCANCDVIVPRDVNSARAHILQYLVNQEA